VASIIMLKAAAVEGFDELQRACCHHLHSENKCDLQCPATITRMSTTAPKLE
jgi:hypothetical protein